MTCLQPVGGRGFRFSRIIGTGGIGSGMFFSLEGDRTLGRNESRPGVLLPWRDYCKQHIILHYLSVLLGHEHFSTYPIGKVGDDNTGRMLLDEMTEAGMDLSGVTVDAESSTLFSVCFQYPDSSGGNITTSNGASGKVSEKNIDDFLSGFDKPDGRELFLAVPEVPMEARLALLRHGRERGGYCAAAVLAQEAQEFLSRGGAESVELLSANIDEAASLAGMDSERSSAEDIAECSYKKLVRQNPDISLIMTNGSHGSYSCCSSRLYRTPPIKAKAVSTAGAGDALFAGVLAGLACGLGLVKENNDSRFSETPLTSALELGTLLASLSVTSPHTIYPEVDASVLVSWAETNGAAFSDEYRALFGCLREE